MRRVALILGILVAFLATVSSAWAERRIALVVGNDRYPSLPADHQLRNAGHDARVVADALRGLGFEIFGGAAPGQHGENLSRNDFIDRLGDLQAKVAPGDIVFVFFAGHGVSIKGANILLPSDIPAPRGLGAAEEDRYVQRGIAEGDLIEQLTGLKAKAVIIALDACRDNPIASGGRAVGGPRGFVQTRLDAAAGAFFFSIYSAGYGQQALDGLGPDDTVTNSVFTRVFVENLRRPGLHIQEVASLTRRTVRRMTMEAMGYDQFLAYMDQLPDPVYLAGLPDNAVLTRAAQDKELVASAESQLARSAAGATASALPLGAEQLRSVLAEAAASRAPAKRAALQMIADGGVEEGARALEAHARDETLLAATLDAAAREQRAGAAQNWREAGAIWRFKSVARAIDNYEKAQQLEPGDFWTDVELARLYRSAGRLSDAHAAVQRLATKNGDPVRIIVAAKESGDILSDRGDLDGAFQQFDRAVRTWEAAGRPDLMSTGILFRGTVPWTWRGDVWLDRGRTSEALSDYRASLAVVQGLAAGPLNDVRIQRELSVAYDKVGDVQMAQGDLAAALTSFRDALAISERLANADPINAGWQRDLSVDYEKVGDVEMMQGNPAAALTSFRTSFAIRERLAKADPNNAGWQHDLSVTYDKIGGAQVEQGNLAEALTSFRQSFAIFQRLAKADPNNTGWQRDLAAAYIRAGDVQMAQANLADALTSFRDSLAIVERLAKADPNNTDWQRSLSVVYEKIGGVQEKQANRAAAVTSFRDSLAISERLAKADPNNALWQIDVLWSNWRLAENGDDAARRWTLIVETLRKMKMENRLSPEDLKWLPIAEEKLSGLKR